MNKNTPATETPIKQVIKKITFAISISIGIILVVSAGTLLYLQYKPTNQLTSLKNDSETNTDFFYIGAIGPLTGQRSTYGIASQRFLQLAIQQINETGGINGKAVGVIWEDGQCNATVAKKAATRHVNRNIKFLIAGLCNEEVLAAVPIVNQKKMVSFTPSATSNSVTQMGQYNFQVSLNNHQITEAAIEFVTKQKPVTQVLLVSEGSSSAELSQEFTTAFINKGGEISQQLSYQPGQTDFSSILEQIQTTNPELIFLNVTHNVPTAYTFLKAIRNSNLHVPILSNSLILNYRQLKYRGQLLNGHHVIDQQIPQSPKFQELLATFKSQYQQEPPYPGVFANIYEILLLIKYASENKPGQPADSYLYNLTNWQGVYPQLKFSSTGETNLPVQIYQITEQQIQSN